MKKKLEAELISIAHRILKLKNRAELDQLQAETLKLYEKISVLRFVEDNFSDVKPTIGFASAEETLEEIYGIEETAPVHANEVEEKEDKARAEKAKEVKGKSEKEEDKEDVAEEPGDQKPEGDADPEQKVEEYQASEEEEQKTEESGEEVKDGPETEAVEEAEEDTEASDEEVGEEETSAAETEEEEAPPAETTASETEEYKEEEVEEPEHKLEVVKPEEEVKAMKDGAAAVFEKEDDSTIEEEEKAADAEVVTIAPDESAKVEDSGTSFDFAFERPAAPEEPAKQKEITFEDYHDYKEPEFVKKGEEAREEAPVAEAPKTETPVDDWRNWEPSKSAETEKPKEEEKKEEPAPVAEAPKPSAPKSLNDAFGKTITLTLNDRIAFEKNLFGGSGDDLNRVVSQLNTLNSYEEAKNFVEDLVKPDYNGWKGKEEYEGRFMEIVEKKFN